MCRTAFPSALVGVEGRPSRFEPENRYIAFPLLMLCSSSGAGVDLEEARDKGRLILCAADVVSGLDDRPAARSFRNALAAYAADPSIEAPELTASEAIEWWEKIRA